MPTDTFFRLPEEKRARILEGAWSEFTAVPYAEVEDVEQAEVDRRAGKLHAVHRGSLFGLCDRLCLRGELADGAAGSSHDLTGDLLDRIRSEGLLRAGEQLLEVRSKHGVRNAGLAHLRNEGGRDGRAAEKVPMDVTAGKQDLMEHIRAAPAVQTA